MPATAADRPLFRCLDNDVAGDGAGASLAAIGDLEELREKLMGHLREAADRMKIVGVSGGREEEAEGRPWTLRPRRAACGGSERACSPSLRTRRPAAAAPAMAGGNGEERTVRLRSEDAEKKKERVRFSVSLTREEIEEDVFAITGALPRRRPRKRPRVQQRQMDALFPGLWLSEITADMYKVDE